MEFKKDNNLMSGKGEDEIQWITVNGWRGPQCPADFQISNSMHIIYYKQRKNQQIM